MEYFYEALSFMTVHPLLRCNSAITTANIQRWATFGYQKLYARRVRFQDTFPALSWDATLNDKQSYIIPLLNAIEANSCQDYIDHHIYSHIYSNRSLFKTIFIGNKQYRSP